MTDVRIAITTGTSGAISLEPEVRLVKPALLYADQITLYSPVASLLQSTASVGRSEKLTLDLMREVGPLIDPTFSEAIQTYDGLVARKHKTRGEMQALIGFRRRLVEGAGEILAKAEEMIEEAGGTELLPAIEAGLLIIDPLFREDGGGEDLFEVFLDRLRELLREGHAYPLFDDQIGSLVRQAVAENAWELGAASRRRGKQVSAAARFMEELPAFPGATVSEILDIREDLRSPLVRFRSAIVEMERLIEAAAYEPDFAAEADSLYQERIAPALLEISELVADNASLRQLVGAAVGETKTILTAALTIGVTASADLPHLVAAAFDILVPAAAVTAQAAWAQSVAIRQAQRHQLFFLYKTNELLELR